MRMTPPIGISGLFTLRTPFTTAENTFYTVTAIRKFSEIISRGQDPVQMVYAPVGLGTEEYSADYHAEAAVICLKSTTGELIYVPDTYIESYPDQGGVPYSRMILSASLGMFPEFRSVDDIKQAVISALEAKTGITPEVFVSRAPTTNYVSDEQHESLTQARLNAITTNETDAAKIIRLNDQVQTLQNKINELNLVIESLTTNPPAA